MQLDDYQLNAVGTMNPNVDAVYLSTKMMVEAAEAAQLVLKRQYHAAPLDLDQLMKELGDVLWYLASLAYAYNITLSDVAAANLVKLEQRHGTVYNPAHYAG